MPGEFIKHNRDLQAIRSAFSVSAIQGNTAIAQWLSDWIQFTYPALGSWQHLRRSTQGSGAAGATSIQVTPTITAGSIWLCRAISASHNDAANATVEIRSLANSTALVTGVSVAASQSVAVPRPHILYPGEIVTAVVTSAGFGAGAVLNVKVEAFELPDSAVQAVFG